MSKITDAASVHRNANLQLEQKTASDVNDDLTIDNEPVIQTLTSLKLRFYIYMDDDIAYKHLWPQHNNITDPLVDETIRIFLPFVSNPLRTMDPDEADLFLVPAPLSIIDNVRQLSSAMEALLAQPTFGDGHGHFLISIYTRHFDAATGKPRMRQFYAQWGPRVENVTMVKDKDDAAVVRLRSDGQNHGDWNKKFQSLSKMYLNTGVSMGLVSFSVPYHAASWKRFTQEQNISIFSHVRNTEYFFGSTPYRLALSKENLTWPQSFLPVSLGGEMAGAEWLHDYLHTKFCLVIRGDDPNSKSFHRAVYAGCIPVIVSDYYRVFSPPFPHLLNIDDFSFSIQERDFLANPRQSVLEALAHVDEHILRDKIYHLRVAQRILCIDHPESLFVQAMLYEVHRVNPHSKNKSNI